MLKRALIVSGCIVVGALALPIAKDLYLFATYEHGRQTLTRVSGEAGQLAGEWEGTFDTYTCGLDERHRIRLTVRPDSTGLLEYRFLADRVGGHVPYAYSWASVLPFDRSKVRDYRALLRFSDGTITIDPEGPWYSEYVEREYAAFEVEGDEMYFAYVVEPGERPERWGLWDSDQLVSLHDIVFGRWLRRSGEVAR